MSPIVIGVWDTQIARETQRKLRGKKNKSAVTARELHAITGPALGLMREQRRDPTPGGMGPGEASECRNVQVIAQGAEEFMRQIKGLVGKWCGRYFK